MALYSEKVMDHFQNPRNVGKIDDADGIGEVGNARCGDIMKITLKIENDVIVDAKFQTFGCAAAIATSSTATQMIIGMTVEEALQLALEHHIEVAEHEKTVGHIINLFFEKYQYIRVI